MSNLPYLAEYAKSGRAACKGCKEKIDQGTLRIAVMVQSAFHDGKQPNWHHEQCFFKKQRPKTVGDIGQFMNLKPSDQKKVKEQIARGALPSSTIDDTTLLVKAEVLAGPSLGESCTANHGNSGLIVSKIAAPVQSMPEDTGRRNPEVEEKINTLASAKIELVLLQKELLKKQIQDEVEKNKHNGILRAMEMEDAVKKYKHLELVRKLELENKIKTEE